MNAAVLVMRQSSAFHAFRHDFLDGQGECIGGFEHAMFAQADNARLKLHVQGSTAGQIHVDLQGERFRVQHEHTRRSWLNDTRYLLVAGDAVLATFDFHRVEGQRWPRLTLRAGPRQIDVGIAGPFYRRRHDLRDAATGMALGVVQGAPGLRLRRVLVIHSPALSLPEKALLGVVFSSFRP